MSTTNTMTASDSARAGLEMGTPRPSARSRATRRGVLLAGSALPLAALAACVPGQAGPEQPSASSQPVTVQWMTDWTGGARGDASKQSLPAFEAQFPKIKLDMQTVKSDSYETFSANLAAGTLPDVMLFSGNFFELWAERNVFMDIGPLLRKYRFDKDSVWWEPQYFEHKGKTHGLPYQFTISTWLYNKTWFTRDNVAPPTDAWTTDDLLAAARKLTHAAENQWAVQMQSAPAYAWVWFYANGGDLTSYTQPIRTVLDQAKQLEVLEYAIGLIHRHQVAPVLEGKNAVKGLNFQQGTFAITVNNSAKALATGIKDQFQWEVMPTPRWAGTKNRVTNWNHQGHIVMKVAEQRGHGDAATQFAIWMAGEGGQTIVGRTGGATPVHRKTATSPVYLDGGPPNLRLQLDLLTKKPDQSARGFRIWKHFQPWFAAITPILAQGFAGEISVRETALKATQAGNAALDAAK